MTTKFTVLDMSEELNKAQLKAIAILNKEVLGDGLKDSTLFNVPSEIIDSAISASPDTELVVSPLDVVHVACLVDDAEKMANTMFKVSNTGNVIGVLTADKWLKYLGKITSIMLAAYIASTMRKANTQGRDLTPDMLENLYGDGVKTISSAANLAVGNLSGTYESLIGSAYRYSSRTFQIKRGWQSQSTDSNFSNASTLLMDDDSIKHHLNELLSSSPLDPSRGSVKDTVILVMNPKLVMVKCEDLFQRIFVRDSTNTAMPADSVLAQLYSQCLEPAVISSCYNCSKVTGSCYESLAQDNGVDWMLESSELFNKVSINRVKAETLISADKSVGRRSSNQKLVGKTASALWSSLSSYSQNTSGSAEYIGEVVEAIIGSISSEGYEYIKPSKAINYSNNVEFGEDRVLPFSKPDPTKVSLSDTTLENNKKYREAQISTRMKRAKFKREYCSNCSIQYACVEYHNGKVNTNCMDTIGHRIESGDAVDPSILSTDKIPVKKYSEAEIEAINYGVKHISSNRNKDTDIVHKAVFYLPGTTIGSTCNWSRDYFLATEVVHENMLKASGVAYTKLVRGKPSTTEVWAGGNLKYSVCYEGPGAYNKQIDKDYPTLRSWNMESILKDSAIGGTNYLLPVDKELSGWLVRLTIVNSNDSMRTDTYHRSIYVDLQVVLESTTCPLVSFVNSRNTISESGLPDDLWSELGLSVVGADLLISGYRHTQGTLATNAVSRVYGTSGGVDHSVKMWFFKDGVTSEDIYGLSLLEAYRKVKSPYFDKKALTRYFSIAASGGLCGYYDLTGSFGHSSRSVASHATITKIHPGTGMVSSLLYQNHYRPKSNFDYMISGDILSTALTNDEKVLTKKAETSYSMMSQSLSWIGRNNKLSWQYGYWSGAGHVKGSEVLSSVKDSLIQGTQLAEKEPNDRNIASAVKSWYSNGTSKGVVTGPPAYRHVSDKTAGLFVYEPSADMPDNFTSSIGSVVIESYKSNTNKKALPKINEMHVADVNGKIKFVSTKPSRVVGDYVGKNICGGKLPDELDDFIASLSSTYGGLISHIEDSLTKSNPDVLDNRKNTSAYAVIRDMLESTIPGEPQDVAESFSRVVMHASGKTAYSQYVRSYYSNKIRSRICVYPTVVTAIITDKATGKVLDRFSSGVGTTMAVFAPSEKSRNKQLMAFNKERQYRKGFGKFYGPVYMTTDEDVARNISICSELMKHDAKQMSIYSYSLGRFGVINYVWKLMTRMEHSF